LLSIVVEEVVEGVVLLCKASKSVT